MLTKYIIHKLLEKRKVGGFPSTFFKYSFLVFEKFNTTHNLTYQEEFLI
jgi:hypothetical protein